MSLTPLAIRKMRFAHRLRGFDPSEVEDFLVAVADELTRTLAESESLLHRTKALEQRLAATEERERELQETLLRAQRVSDEILANSQREAQLVVREAEITADRIVQQAIDQAQGVERRVADLRLRRRELHAKLQNTLDLFSEMVSADIADDERLASVRTLPRPPRASPGSS